ncbi:ABC transporter ATP-binding protein [Lacisediminihabitans changchengi]|uniref:ABC transporter ATP-binding protein n=1 Tax=Lacisediminihabitans changchengi TaxID=2787634 RepID=A0A934SR06_9MICO|nr:ATP-binding cassette domain-containing protein [Lacisediminihabitans changchengi]MBK4347453.1 ABC transporter ATP-binding protein [Lacisediminihabitans changchengi]
MTALSAAPLLTATRLSRDYHLPREGIFARPLVKPALRDVDLTIDHGEALAIIGESGSGKSTLMRLLLALDTPTAGTIEFEGRPVMRGTARSLRWLRRETGIVLQDPYASLDPRMSVGAIIAEPLQALGIAGDHHAMVARILERVGLEADSVDRYPHEFSGGQRQRIALSRALVHGPRLLVGDEPLSALDVTVRAQILELLRDLRRDLGLSMILVSHDIGLVYHLCERIMVMKDGIVVESGPTLAVLEDPQHPYTRQLIAAVPSLDASTGAAE